jgi:hypothetical protein
MPRKHQTIEARIKACIERIGLSAATHERIRACVQEERPDLRVPSSIITTVLRLIYKQDRPQKLRPGRPVIIDGREYRSIREAARQVGLTHTGVAIRLQSDAYPGWRYANSTGASRQ